VQKSSPILTDIMPKSPPILTDIMPKSPPILKRWCDKKSIKKFKKY